MWRTVKLSFTRCAGFSIFSKNVSSLSYIHFYRVFYRVKNEFSTFSTCVSSLSYHFITCFHRVTKIFYPPFYPMSLYFKIITESVSHVVAFDFVKVHLSIFHPCCQNVFAFERSPRKDTLEAQRKHNPSKVLSKTRLSSN